MHYQLSYWKNNVKEICHYPFRSLWAAIMRGRAVRETGKPVEIMNLTTGKIVVNFPLEGAAYAASDLPQELKDLVALPF